jgi:hypothetical protein
VDKRKAYAAQKRQIENGLGEPAGGFVVQRLYQERHYDHARFRFGISLPLRLRGQQLSSVAMQQ